MPITLRYRIVTAIAGAAIAVGVHALASQPGAPAAGQPGGATVVRDVTGTAAQATTVLYWTSARMAAALRAADGQPTAKRPTTANPGVTVPPAGKKRRAEKPVSRARRLTRKAPPVPPTPPGPWLTGDTAGRGLRWTHGGAVATAVGKIFFTLAGEDYVCSGTLVGGKHPDVVLTAAHCVTGGPSPANTGRANTGRANTGRPNTGRPNTGQGGTTQWATNWMFVPGFRDGLMPYGEYTARRFFVTPDWTGPQDGSEQYDVAFVQVTAATLYGESRAAQPPPGLPVKFANSQDAASLTRAYVFGYPAEPPYGGLYVDYCAGPVAASGGSVRTPCWMTAGDSGGPWLAGFSPRSGSGPVVAVSTYKVSGDLRVLYGAVLGPQARALYERAVSLAR
jgi:V8-like Glu-specific endopeptidase